MNIILQKWDSCLYSLLGNVQVGQATKARWQSSGRFQSLNLPVFMAYVQNSGPE